MPPPLTTATLIVEHPMRKALSLLLVPVLALACSASSTSTPAQQGPLPGTPVRKGPPPFSVGSFKATPPAVTLAPGEEQSPCFIVPLELPAASKIVGGARLVVGKGMHHGNITTRPRTAGDGPRPCVKDDNAFGGEAVDVAAGGAVLFGSSTQFSGEEWQGFPEGMGYRLKDGFEIVLRMHYLNTTPAPVTVQPTYEWFVIDEKKMKQEVAPFTWIYTSFRIPPKAQNYEIRGQCKIPRPMHIIQVLPHMHRMGRSITSGYVGGPKDGQLWLSSRGYDPDNGVMVAYDPAIDTSVSEELFFTCAWNNSTNKELVWGIGDDEMCQIFGYAWPPEAAYSLIASAHSCAAIVNSR